ncbi:hypothetical protein [Clostridium sp.]
MLINAVTINTAKDSSEIENIITNIKYIFVIQSLWSCLES